MVNRSVRLAAVLATVAAAPAAAQGLAQPIVTDAMFAQANGLYLPASCSAKKLNDSKVKNAEKALQGAVREKDIAKRTTMVKDAIAQATEGAPKEKGPGGYYLLGRASLFAGDVAGADAALDKAVELGPDCKDEIEDLRLIPWANIVNAALGAANGGRDAEAVELYRAANTLSMKRPEALSRFAIWFAGKGQVDSAILYLRQAVAAAGADTALAQERQLAQANLALNLQRAEKHAEAIVVLREVMKENPNDLDAVRMMATSHRAAGAADSAAFYEAKMLERATAAGAGGGDEAGVSAGELFNIAVNLFNDGKYPQAAEVFGRVLQREPYNRDALQNQSIALYNAKDWAKLLVSAGTMAKREPLNETMLLMLRDAHRELKQQDSVMAVVNRIVVIPAKLDLTKAQLGETTKVEYTATGREAGDPKTGKVIPPKAFTLAFEFLGKDGAVLATQDVTVPALKKDETKVVAAEGKAKGIAGWRYSIK